ncbi:nuclear transport factor 2 family protein [Colwellia sp. MSW7]|uniref:Nuclear transport factor 2 family protein n=1 Tax=Colwellia maritima TaxID=2912588 RepID=A0ABS9X0N4_9GAMM|nr:nuclear transport factor 2 family protein [Colwellia maritima]MCI2283719.1 nuclear transport factor 2 family protein [Colwellia maritima]
MKIIPMILITASFLTLVVSNDSIAHSNENKKQRIYPENSGAETDAGKAIIEFHKALKLGHKKKARSLLDDNVIIFEGGGVEKSADEYANHHMLADMKYLAKIKTEVLTHNVKIVGDMAYSMSQTKSTGQVKGKYINSEGMESMVLQKNNNKWKIVHIHWSN